MVVLTKSQKVFISLLVGFVIVAAAVTYYIARSGLGPNEAERAFYPDAAAVDQYKDLNGNVVTVTESLGEVTVVTVWASWSPYSQVELPILNELATEYGERGVAFIALNRKEPKEQAQRFLSTLPELKNITYVIDTADTFYAAVGGFTMPETIIYNEKGEVIEHFRTVITADMVREAINRALEE
jgi:thiol-disulfide isomerase/thioredoxin